MFEGIKSRFYGAKVLKIVEDELIAVHGSDRGKECVGMFATAMTKSQEYGEMPADLMERIRRGGFSAEDAAVSYLDASVTAIKRLLAKSGSSPDIDAVVADMEKGIDHMFLKFKGLVIPRNGIAGPYLSGFSTDPDHSSNDQ